MNPLHQAMKTALAKALRKEAGALELAKQLGGKVAPPRVLGFKGMAQKLVTGLKK